MNTNTTTQATGKGPSVSHNMVTTGFELDNYKIVKNLGVARGIIVRSRNIFGTIGAGLQTLVGGNITLYTNLCEKTREHAFDLMRDGRERRHRRPLRCHGDHARRHGSLGIRHGSSGGGTIKKAATHTVMVRRDGCR
jgi:hypothetical protein